MVKSGVHTLHYVVNGQVLLKPQQLSASCIGARCAIRKFVIQFNFKVGIKSDEKDENTLKKANSPTMPIHGASSSTLKIEDDEVEEQEFEWPEIELNNSRTFELLNVMIDASCLYIGVSIMLYMLFEKM